MARRRTFKGDFKAPVVVEELTGNEASDERMPVYNDQGEPFPGGIIALGRVRIDG